MPAPGISPADYQAFVTQMGLLVHEDAALWETPLQSTVVRAGSNEVHGPWPPEACAWLLLRWLEAGLIGLFRPRFGSDAQDLSLEEAREALAAPEKWEPGKGEVRLFATDHGKASAYEVWLRAVDPPPA